MPRIAAAVGRSVTAPRAWMSSTVQIRACVGATVGPFIDEGGGARLGGLQADLELHSHPVTVWLKARFPYRDAWRRRWQLRAAEPERATASGPATLGKAF